MTVGKDCDGQLRLVNLPKVTEWVSSPLPTSPMNTSCEWDNINSLCHFVQMQPTAKIKLLRS